MPTMLVIDGIAVRIHLTPREHGPPHVHVRKAGTPVVMLLGDSEQGPTVRGVHGMSKLDVGRAYRIVAAHQELLLQRWRHYHG